MVNRVDQTTNKNWTGVPPNRSTGQTASAILETFREALLHRHVFLAPLVSKSIPRLMDKAVYTSRALELECHIVRRGVQCTDIRILDNHALDNNIISEIHIRPLDNIVERLRGIEDYVFIFDPCHYIKNIPRELMELKAMFRYEYVGNKGVIKFHRR